MTRERALSTSAVRAVSLTLLACAFAGASWAEDDRAAGAAPATSFTVRVRSLEGKPVEGASIRAVAATDTFSGPGGPGRWAGPDEVPPDPDEPLSAVATTDARGLARIAAVPAGWYWIAADAPGLGRAAYRAAWCAGDPPTEVAIPLARAASLRVRVVDSAGRPRAAAMVVVAPPGPGTGPVPTVLAHRAVTSDDGTCTFDRLGWGENTVWVGPSTKLAQRAGGRVPPLLRSCSVRLPGPERVDVTLPDGAVLEGRVLGPRNQPVAGARVRFVASAFWEDGEQPPRPLEIAAEATTDAEGRFRTRTWRRAIYLYWIDVSAPGMALLIQRMTRRNWHDEMTCSLELGMESEAVVEGNIKDPDGRGVPDARVFVAFVGPGIVPWRGVAATRTDGNGDWRLGGLPGARIAVRVDADRLRRAEADDWDRPLQDSWSPFWDSIPPAWLLSTSPGARSRHDVRLVTVGSGADRRFTVAGRVVDMAGVPVPHADLWFETARWRCDAVVARSLSRSDGTFAARYTADEHPCLRISAKSRRGDTPGGDDFGYPGHVAVREGQDDAIVIRVAGVVRGRVRSAHGLPVAGARLRIGERRQAGEEEEFVEWHDRDAGVAAQDGSFEIPLAPWPQRLVAHGEPLDGLVLAVDAPGHAPKLSAPVKNATVLEGVPVDVTVDRGVTLVGRLCDPSKRPVADTEVRIRVERQDRWPPDPRLPIDFLAAMTDAEGRFRIPNLPPIPVTVLAGGAEAEVDLAIQTNVQLTAAPK